jgi:hypothetical protein
VKENHSNVQQPADENLYQKLDKAENRSLCMKCFCYFASPTKLVEHDNKIHSNASGRDCCTRCDINPFILPSDMRRHLKESHLIESEPENTDLEDTLDDAENPNKIRCMKCFYFLGNPEKLVEHDDRVHSDALGKVKCNFCVINPFILPSDMHRHLKEHHLYESEPGDTSNSSRKLAAAKIPDKIRCMKCFCFLGNRERLVEHDKRIHSDDFEREKCPLCRVNPFIHACHMKKHLIEAHGVKN